MLWMCCEYQPEDAFIQLEEIQAVKGISQGISSPMGYGCTVITH